MSVRILSRVALAMALTLVVPAAARAHCDGLDGPVVKAAQKALAAKNVALVLIWVQEKDEAEIRAAFDRTLAVRTLSPEARALADRYFFETLVRVHRAGEGEPYTGLKPAGRDLGPAIPAVDKALEKRSVEPILNLFRTELDARLQELFTEVAAADRFKDTDVAAGREWVKAYVQLLHFAERMQAALYPSPHGH